MNTVILITNKEEIKQKLQNNPVLLRETDRLLAVNYDNAADVLYEIRPDIILLHEHDRREKTINLIKYIKEKKIYNNANIILLLDNYDRGFILSAYDEGIDDYLQSQAEPSEILIRIINSIKKSELNHKIERLTANLEYYGIIDNETGFYNTKFETEIINLELHKFANESLIFMILTPDEEGKKEFSHEAMIQAIQNSVRIGDIVVGPSGARYELLLKTDIDGAIKVLEKIKAELSSAYSIKAGLAVVNDKKFDDIKKKATCALNDALLEDKDYTVYSQSEIVTDEWLEDSKSDEKAYKLFKGAIDKKIDNVIAPVFYRVQKAYEEQLGNAKIEQFTDDHQSIFRIIHGKNESRITMVYPGFSKLVVYITHSGLDSPENREITLPLNQVNQSKISEILESFVNEFIGIYRHLYK